MNSYRGKRRGELMQMPPHCYAVAEDSYQLMHRTQKNQARNRSPARLRTAPAAEPAARARVRACAVDGHLR
jgi:hypothetical protein